MVWARSRAIETGDEKSPNKLSGAFSAVGAAIIAAAIPATVFYAGWLFLSAYLRPFGIQVSELPLDAWQIGAFALSGLDFLQTSSSGSFSLAWLPALLAAVVAAVWSMEETRWRRVLEITAGLTAGLTFILLLWAMIAVGETGTKVANSVLSGKGVFIAPYVSNSLSTSAPRNAIKSCVEGERLRPIFLTRDMSWTYCKSRSEKNKGFVFSIKNDGTLVSMRRVSIK